MCQTWQTLWSIINFSLIEGVKSLLQLAIINDRANGDVRPCQSGFFLQFSCLCSFQFPSRLIGKPRVVTRTLWPSISLELQVASSWLYSSLRGCQQLQDAFRSAVSSGEKVMKEVQRASALSFCHPSRWLLRRVTEPAKCLFFYVCTDFIVILSSGFGLI